MRTRSAPTEPKAGCQTRLVKRPKRCLCNCDAGSRELPHQRQQLKPSPGPRKKEVLSSAVQPQKKKSREILISLNASMSPIIRRKRPALEPSKLSNQASGQKQSNSEKENQDAPRKFSEAKVLLLSPLRERMNITTMSKGSEAGKEANTRKTKGKRRVNTDKENTLITSKGEPPARKSKRDKVATKNRDIRDMMKPQGKRQEVEKESEKEDRRQEVAVCKGRGPLARVVKKEINPQLKLQKDVKDTQKPCTPPIQTKNITTRPDNKENSDRACNRSIVAATQAVDENEDTLKSSKQTLPLKRKLTRKENKYLPRQIKKSAFEMSKCIGNSGLAKVSSTVAERGAEGGRGKCISPAQVKRTPCLLKNTPLRPQNTVQSPSAACTSTQLGKASCNKPKLPIWASVRGTKVTPGKRKSMRINSDTYDFPSGSPSEGEKDVKKRRINKPRNQVKRKKVKPLTKLTLLTTDPSWQVSVPKTLSSSGTSTVTTSGQSALPNCLNMSVVSDQVDDGSIPSNMSSIRDEEPAEEMSGEFDFDGFDSQDSEGIFHGFEGETASSFAPSQNKNSRPIVPMTSASVLPTPALSRHISKYIGGSSTPRTENTENVPPSQEPKTIEDSIAQCFGFDDEEEEKELSISPVRQSRLQHLLEVTGSSDVSDGAFQPASLPSRFSWSSFRLGNRSTMSASCSTSLVARGRSVSASRNVSSFSQPSISSFVVPSVGRRGVKSKKRETHKHDIRKGNMRSRTRIVEKEAENVDANVSVFFDEEDGAVANKPAEGTEERELLQPSTSSAAPLSLSPNGDMPDSPEKQFVKVPRRSYDRSSLKEARRRFIEMHGGFAVTDTETEEEEEEEEEHPEIRKNKKPKNTKPTKVPKKTVRKGSKKTATTSKGLQRTVSSAPARKTYGSQYDKSLDEWASHLNSHFSEVEDSMLVVE